MRRIDYDAAIGEVLGVLKEAICNDAPHARNLVLHARDLLDKLSREDVVTPRATEAPAGEVEVERRMGELTRAMVERGEPR